MALVFLAFTGFVISLWPNIIPPSVTIWQAAAPHSSQMFALVGALILIPIIITYTIVSYWVFRDKVRVGDEGYRGCYEKSSVKLSQTQWFILLWLGGF